MKPTVPPCPGFSAQRWQEMREAAIDFLDRFGEDDVALGWTATDLFGVHPTVGVVRVDYCGCLMINARRVEAIGDTWIRYGNQTYHRAGPGRGGPGRPVGVPVCRCGRPRSRREDHRRVGSGVQYLIATNTVLTHPVSRQWKGYWQRGLATA
ncbi:hypothetical protein FV223_13245 [Methylobacterium sp. WL116]|nr:hypothetical protein FV223_13245 [Methylobacterium sp. WL116]